MQRNRFLILLNKLCIFVYKKHYDHIMKKLLSLTALCFLTVTIFGQNKVYYKVKTSPSNTLYMGFNNPIGLEDSSLLKSSYPVVLKSNNGKVVLRNGTYYMLPSHLGEATLKVSYAKGKDTVLVGEQTFAVKPVYMPVMALSGKVLDSVISKSEIMKEQHFKVQMPESDYNVRFALTSCKIKFSNGRSYDLQQGVIGLTIKKEVSRLKPGTKVCFEDIKILEFTGAERKLDNACYTLVE